MTHYFPINLSYTCASHEATLAFTLTRVSGDFLLGKISVSPASH